MYPDEDNLARGGFDFCFEVIVLTNEPLFLPVNKAEILKLNALMKWRKSLSLALSSKEKGKEAF